MQCCREQQDLGAGAVLQAVTQEGEGTATPQDGDLVSTCPFLEGVTLPCMDSTLHTEMVGHKRACLPCFVQVYVHYSVLDAENDLLYTTWAEEGGSGQPLAFVLGKGCRAPRAWELAVLGETAAQWHLSSHSNCNSRSAAYQSC